MLPNTLAHNLDHTLNLAFDLDKNHIMQIIIHDGRVIDPGNINGVRDILLDNGIITDIVESGKIPHLPAEAGEKTTRIINANGWIK